MLADKTLLSVTLAATFASGCFVGVAVKQRAGAPPHNASAIYADQLHELELKGYDAAEMAEAREVYVDYLKSYDNWFTEFLEVHHQNVDIVEDKFTRRLATLDAKHRQRTGAK